MATTFTPGSLATQTTLLEANQNRMLSQINSAKGSVDDAKIDKGAQEFESMLLGSWLQQAEQSMASVPGAEDDEDAAGREQMMSLGVQSLASSMAASGGIGIGKMIAKAMHATAVKAAEAEGTKSVNGSH
jgi:Rod binding domain-containing protein